jgi:hypothetical protein
VTLSSTGTRDEVAVLRRQVRLMVLLRAAEEAGLVPLQILRLHTFAFLSNVLAPVWDLDTLDGKVLKRRGGPFYPSLQHDLDRLVGMGVAVITGLSHARDEDNRWRLEGAYRLNFDLAQRPLDCVATFEPERRLAVFLQELAFALSALTDQELDYAMTEDATYADPVVAVGNVVDFAEWQHKNWSANAANHFDRLMPGGIRATPGEKLHLYVRHLHARLQQAG